MKTPTIHVLSLLYQRSAVFYNSASFVCFYACTRFSVEVCMELCAVIVHVCVNVYVCLDIACLYVKKSAPFRIRGCKDNMFGCQIKEEASLLVWVVALFPQSLVCVCAQNCRTAFVASPVCLFSHRKNALFVYGGETFVARSRSNEVHFCPHHIFPSARK